MWRYKNATITIPPHSGTAIKQLTPSFQNAFGGMKRKTTASTSDEVLSNKPLHIDMDQKPVVYA